MASEGIELLVSAILGAIGVGLDVGLGGGDTFDLLQYENTNDILTKPTLNNECIFYLTGRPGTEDTTFINVSAMIKCGDEDKLVGSWNNPPVGEDLTFTDDRVGTITVNFQDSNSNEYPYPGETIVHNPAWSERGWGDAIGIKDCISLSEKGLISAKDCNGKDTATNVCTQGFADGYEGVIDDDNIVEHGWVQIMALPQQGVNPVCPDNASKVKRTLSRFEID